MTFIAEGGGRTVTNGTVFDRRKVYEVTCSVVQLVVQSNGLGEVEPTGETVTKEVAYHLIATSEELVRTLYHDKWGGEFRRHTLLSVKPLFCIDAEINTGYN